MNRVLRESGGGMALIEALEGRRMMSISPADCADLSLPDRSDGQLDRYFACLRLEATLPKLVGKYKGTVTSSLAPAPLAARFEIKRQTIDGVVDGTLSADNLGSFDFSAKADIRPDRTFVLRYGQTGLTGTLQGKVNKRGGLAGTFALTQTGLPLPLAGTFAFSRVGK